MIQLALSLLLNTRKIYLLALGLSAKCRILHEVTEKKETKLKSASHCIPHSAE